VIISFDIKLIEIVNNFLFHFAKLYIIRFDTTYQIPINNSLHVIFLKLFITPPDSLTVGKDTP